MSKLLIVQGALYTIIGGLAPVAALFASTPADQTLSNRAIISVTIAGIVAGATALKAFLSTTFAESKESQLPIK